MVVASTVRRRLRSLGAGDGAAHRQIYSGEPVDRGAKHAWRRQHHRRELRVWRRQARRLDPRRRQSRALFRSTGGQIRSEIRLGANSTGSVRRKKTTSSPTCAPTRRSRPSTIWRNAKEPPKCGSTGTGSTGHYIPRLLEETLGIKTQIVSGYPGAPDIELAIERGEVFCWSPLLATYFGREPYRRWHKSGYVRVLMQTGAKRDARLKDTPTLNELMQQYKTAEAGPPSRQSHFNCRHPRPARRHRAWHARRPRQDFARCLCQSARRSGVARRSRQTGMGSRSNQRRRTASLVQGSHDPAT